MLFAWASAMENGKIPETIVVEGSIFGHQLELPFA
jgi:hypothetical protein